MRTSLRSSVLVDKAYIRKAPLAERTSLPRAFFHNYQYFSIKELLLLFYHLKNANARAIIYVMTKKYRERSGHGGVKAFGNR